MELLAGILKQLYTEKSYYHPRIELRNTNSTESNAQAFKEFEESFTALSGQPPKQPNRAHFLQLLALLAKL
jgi:hypothetical protein